MDALKGVDAEFPAGAVTAVVGASGSGKSSLLRLLAGLDTPTAGTVSVRGRDLTTASPKALRAVRRRIVGYVFQRPADNLIPYLSLEEHVRVAADGEEARLTGEELLDRIGLAHRRTHRPGELSGGEQQRAAFAFALTAGARIVVADEPTAELDSRSAAEVLAVVRRLTARGVAFVVATHDRAVTRIADEIVELDHGRVKEAGVQARPSLDDRGPSPGSVGAERIAVASGLSKSYLRGRERIDALANVGLELRRGELTGLVGRSGSGKTTLLNIFAGWERPDAGTVAWLWTAAPAGAADFRWDDLAVVPQKFGLIEEFTVRENIEYPVRLAGRFGEARSAVDALLVDLGLEELAGRLPSETSVGQQQRAALARALVLSPRVLLADEPSGHQDAGWAEGVFEALRSATRQGTACLVATHNEDMTRYFDTIYRVESGRLAASSAETA